ncbi:hypothetical protein LWI28_010347 [Acer negundo]|uniref:Uncharacterized protein n=1 Tax=Acer negundo TaxID=4023 RepID=A0AAD5IE37_ACENE|nr:hypothetical protein LWI28_010347 [Acer negundo]
MLSSSQAFRFRIGPANGYAAPEYLETVTCDDDSDSDDGTERNARRRRQKCHNAMQLAVNGFTKTERPSLRPRFRGGHYVAYKAAQLTQMNQFSFEGFFHFTAPEIPRGGARNAITPRNWQPMVSRRRRGHP